MPMPDYIPGDAQKRPIEQPVVEQPVEQPVTKKSAVKNNDASDNQDVSQKPVKPAVNKPVAK